MEFRSLQAEEAISQGIKLQRYGSQRSRSTSRQARRKPDAHPSRRADKSSYLDENPCINWPLSALRAVLSAVYAPHGGHFETSCTFFATPGTMRTSAGCLTRLKTSPASRTSRCGFKGNRKNYHSVRHLRFRDHPAIVKRKDTRDFARFASLNGQPAQLVNGSMQYQPFPETPLAIIEPLVEPCSPTQAVVVIV
ncbi:hypothetical protein EI94DRAFT_1789879 [Lactarius quietus]|nr:hypothetical protein EI94DRAFT_1789879 [Lactarius quietus]